MKKIIQSPNNLYFTIEFQAPNKRCFCVLSIFCCFFPYFVLYYHQCLLGIPILPRDYFFPYRSLSISSVRSGGHFALSSKCFCSTFCGHHQFPVIWCPEPSVHVIWTELTTKPFKSKNDRGKNLFSNGLIILLLLNIMLNQINFLPKFEQYLRARFFEQAPLTYQT